MKIKFLGSGSAFTTSNFQSNLLIEDNERKFLIDCGSDIRWALKEAKVSVMDITDIYVSHLHADHIGGLEYVGFMRKFIPGSTKPILHCPSVLVNSLWNDALRAGMESIQGEVATLDTYFDVKRVKDNKKFKVGSTEYLPVQTIHIMNGYSFVPSYGLMFDANGTKIFFTSDTQHAPNQIIDFYKKADIIFQDCETSFKSGVHAHYSDLVTLPSDIKSKMWLYHYNDGLLPNAVADGFAGFVLKGQEFNYESSN